MSEIRVNLRNARKRAGLSQSALAVLCGWENENGGPAQTTVSMWETGERDIKLEDALKWADACGVPLYELVMPKEMRAPDEGASKSSPSPILRAYVSSPAEIRAVMDDLLGQKNRELQTFFANLYWSTKTTFERGGLKGREEEEFLDESEADVESAPRQPSHPRKRTKGEA